MSRESDNPDPSFHACVLQAIAELQRLKLPEHQARRLRQLEIELTKSNSLVAFTEFADEISQMATKVVYRGESPDTQQGVV